MNAKHRSGLPRAAAFVVAVAVALTGAISSNAKAEETSPIAGIFDFLKGYGLDGSNLILTALGELGLTGSSGPSLEEIKQLVDNAVVELKTALVAHTAEIKSHINAITVVELQSCAEDAIDNYLIIETMDPLVLQLKALDAKSCYTLIKNHIAAFTPLPGQPADPTNGPMLHALGMTLENLESWVEKYYMKAGFTASGSGWSALAAMDLGVITELRGELIASNHNLKRGLAPACGVTEMGREGNRVEIQRWCQAFNGNRATRSGFYTIPNSPPAFDYTLLQQQAMRGTAYELADLMLPELQKPVAGVGCVAEVNALRCGAGNFEPTGIATTTTRWWVNNTAVPAWNDDQSDVTRSCEAGTLYTVRVEITNTLGYLDDSQTARIMCRGNRALSRPATADSSCSAMQGAAKAVDGIVKGTNNKWCSVGTSKWWQVALEGSFKVEAVTVRHAGAGAEPSGLNTRDFTIQVSADGTHWTTVATVTGNTRNVTEHVIKSIAVRYVRVNITKPTSTSDTAARLYEVEVYI